jgi:hypothetical protein
MNEFHNFANDMSAQLSQQIEHGDMQGTEWLQLTVDDMSFVFLRQPLWPEGITIYGHCGPVPPVHREELMAAAMEQNFVTGHQNAPIYGFDRDSGKLVAIYKVRLREANPAEIIARLQAVAQQCSDWVAAGLVVEETAA